jgi:hypothetical protein
MKIEITFTNEHGEVLTLKTTERGQMIFNHSDIHESPENFEDISMLQKYVLQESEMKVIKAFTDIGMYILNDLIEKENNK